MAAIPGSISPGCARPLYGKHSLDNLITTRIQSGQPLLLDGGLATQLESHGVVLDPELWSAALIFDRPQALIDAHAEFLEAGAQCITSASYQASLEGFMRRGYSTRESEELVVRSVQLALLARERFMKGKAKHVTPPWVAASVGPWGAVQHDGSEYSGNYAASTEQLSDFHRARLALLDSAGADVLACETIPSAREAEVLADLLQHTRTPAWLSFSCCDGKSISDGTPIAEMATLFRNHPNLLAFGINCTAPRFVESLIGEIRGTRLNLPIVVYPNSGEIYDAKSKTWSGTVNPEDAGKMAICWLKAGAQIVGGCCRMGSGHIRSMSQAINTH